MDLKRIFFITMAFFFLFWGFFGSADVSNSRSKAYERVQQIDNELEELKEMKRGFEGRALRHESQAEYLQFDDRAFLETRRHLQIADENRQKAAKVQERIDDLEAEKQKILGAS